MPRTDRIRQRLVTVILLGVVTSALSVIALVRILSVTTAQRVERGRDAVHEAIGRLATAPVAGRAEALATSVDVVGMRGGYAHPGEPIAAAVPPAWLPLLADAVARAASAGAPVTQDGSVNGGTLVVAARPAPGGAVAWVGYMVPPPSYYLRTWQVIVVALSLATGLLVAASLTAVIAFQRSASALTAALAGLARDLRTPVPRPRVRELSDVADGIAGLAESLARSREMEERLGRELASKERLAALGRVVAGVAHEVRNPLASIKLRLDLVASDRGAALPPSVEQAIAHATSEITRLDRLVADLLVVAGRALGTRQSASIGGLVRERAFALQPWVRSRGVTVETRGDGWAQVDIDSLARAIDNLLRNAVEASPAGATVTVDVAESGGEVRVRFEDRGAGVAAERVAELFEPFFTTKAQGTGLGLAISRAIARAHGGEVTYARVDAVTRFELALPRASAPRPQEAAAS